MRTSLKSIIVEVISSLLLRSNIFNEGSSFKRVSNYILYKLQLLKREEVEFHDVHNKIFLVPKNSLYSRECDFYIYYHLYTIFIYIFLRRFRKPSGINFSSYFIKKTTTRLQFSPSFIKDLLDQNCIPPLIFQSLVDD